MSSDERDGHMESGFTIDGAVYPMPSINGFTNGERRIFFDYCGQVEEDYVKLQDETEEEYDRRQRQMMKHPGFIPALMHIAYARGNPGIRREKVAEIIDGTVYVDAIQTLEVVEEENPPASNSQSELLSGSDSRPSLNTEDSGSLSTNGSDDPGKTHEGIGTSASVT